MVWYYKYTILTNMDHIIFKIRSTPSTISILLAMERSEAVRCFGTRVSTLWNMILYLRHGTVQVHYFDEDRSHNVRNMFIPFYNVYIIGNELIGGSEMLWNL